MFGKKKTQITIEQLVETDKYAAMFPRYDNRTLAKHFGVSESIISEARAIVNQRNDDMQIGAYRTGFSGSKS